MSFLIVAGKKKSREDIVFLPGRGHQGPEQRKVAPVRYWVGYIGVFGRADCERHGQRWSYLFWLQQYLNTL